MDETEKRQEEIAAAKNQQDAAVKAVVADQVKQTEAVAKKAPVKTEFPSANHGIAYQQKH